MEDTTPKQIMSAIISIMDSPVVIYRPLIDLAGSVNAALMLSQCMYWAKRPTINYGWFYKSSEEWSTEIGLSRRELDTARKSLRERGFIETKVCGSPPVMHYRLDLEKLLESTLAWEAQFGGNEQINLAECAISIWRNAPNQFGGNEQILLLEKETTTKNTRTKTTRKKNTPLRVVPGETDTPNETSTPLEVFENPPIDTLRETGNNPPPKGPPPADEPLPPELLAIPGFAEEWESFKTYRATTKHRAMTPEAQRRQIIAALDAHRLGWDLLKLIDQSVASGYAIFVYPQHRENPPRRVNSFTVTEDAPRLKPGMN